jgi:hypothetical protein
MAGLIAGAEIMFGGRTPHPYHTRPGLVSQGIPPACTDQALRKVKNRHSLGLDMNNKVELSIADVVQ